VGGKDKQREGKRREDVMALNQCPGQNRLFWKPDDIFNAECPHCKHEMEFWKDDIRRECPECHKQVVNPKLDLACAQWCKWADKCLEGLTLEDRLIAAAKDVFGDDDKRVAHALRVLEYAKRILETEEADAQVVVAAAALHDIGIPESERKHGNAAPENQHQEGPPIAREILTRLGVEAEEVEKVCDIIGHHHTPRNEETPEFNVVFDADVLRNWMESGPPDLTPELETKINKAFRTEGGRRLAKSVFLRAAAEKDA